jgi:hypothetical protein
MLTRNQIQINITKFSKCEQALGDNIVLNLKKGNLMYSFKDAETYFIVKTIIANNLCIDSVVNLNNLYDILQDICNTCSINLKLPADLGGQINNIIFGIITESNILMIEENNINILIQE